MRGMSKSKTIFIWVDNFLEKSRKVLLNIFTVFILLTISLGFLGGLASMFTGEESVKTKGQILYLEPSGFVVDNAVESNDPFSDYFSTSPSQIELDDLLKIIDNAGKDKNLKAFKHEGFWKCMDNLRDKIILEDLFLKKEEIWKK